jgi:phosphotriesterase-related protein
VVSPDRYDRADEIETAIPYLEALRDAGGETLVECTPAYLGRDVHVLQELSRRTGVRILSNTGYYGANGDEHLPEHAFEESADRLAERWTNEWETGIDGTDVRPGFIKIGVDPQPLSAVDGKLVRAACRTHLETGLTIAAHTGPAVPAFEQLAVLEEEGVDPAAWIWVHAQNESDRDRHVEAARRGGWVEFDGYEPERTEEYVEILQDMREAEVLGRVLISQDNGWYHVGESGGGTFQPYDDLFTELVPRLREEGFSAGDVRRLTVENPARAFTRRVRAAG